jgi:cephalosporin hydroxylase
MTVKESFHHRIKNPSDISEHLCTLRLLATRCSKITEFGVRSGNSTIAFLAGLPERGHLLSFDINAPAFVPPDDIGNRWTCLKADTSRLPLIGETDMLFIDTLHTYDQVVAELKHGNQAQSWIVLHDTVLFGTNGEVGLPGINAAITEFLSQNPHWEIFADCQHNNGLLILERL